MLLHGEAVNIDMALTTVLSAQRGLLTAGERDRVLGLMTRLGLPLWHQCCNIDLLVKVGSVMVWNGVGIRSFKARAAIPQISDVVLGAVSS
jgi:hypothetical protein